MELLERRTYRGPSLYAHFPVIRLELDLGELEKHPEDLPELLAYWKIIRKRLWLIILLMLLAGLSPVTNFLKGWAPDWIVDAISGISFMTRFNSISRGVIELRDLFFFVSLILVCLVATTWVVQAKKAA